MGCIRSVWWQTDGMGWTVTGKKEKGYEAMATTEGGGNSCQPEWQQWAAEARDIHKTVSEAMCRGQMRK